MQSNATTTPAPCKRIVCLQLTESQRVELQPYMDLATTGVGAIFMVFNNSFDAGTGQLTAEMQAAILPWTEAKTTLNHLRKLFGKKPIPAAPKRRKTKND